MHACVCNYVHVQYSTMIVIAELGTYYVLAILMH